MNLYLVCQAPLRAESFATVFGVMAQNISWSVMQKDITGRAQRLKK